MMVSESQHLRRDSFEFKKRSSFSRHDLDYKMKMLQLTLVYRRSVADERPLPAPQPNRHSIAQETFGKAKQIAITQPFHVPKILAVEPKQRKDPKAAKDKKVIVSVTSATLPPNPQHSKVQRLVRMFENNSSTVPKNCPEVHSKPSSVPGKRLPESQAKRLSSFEPKSQLQQEKKKPQIEKTANNTGESVPSDEEIKTELKQRRKVKLLCKFFEQQAKIWFILLFDSLIPCRVSALVIVILRHRKSQSDQ